MEIADMTEPNATNVADTTANAEVKAPETTTEQDSPSERLLRESKAFKSRALAAERELETIKKASLQEQGKYKEMYEATQGKYDSLLKNLVKEKIRSSVGECATKAGCVNVDALLKLGNAGLLEYDEENGLVNGSDLFVEDARKQHPYLFNASKTAAINPATPGGAMKPKTLTAEDIAKLPLDQKMKIWNIRNHTIKIA